MASAGLAGLRAQSLLHTLLRLLPELLLSSQGNGLTDVSVFVNGVGTGREAAVRALNANGLVVTSIKDVTPVPHNGCRQRKPRRV